MKQTNIMIIIAFCLSLLFLTACDGILVPSKIDNENSIDQNSNNNMETDTGDAENMEETDNIEKDITKPIIIGSKEPLPNSWGWNNTDVMVIFTCKEEGSIQSGIVTNTITSSIIVTTEGENQSVTSSGECIDAAGNVADQVTVSDINIDKTPPIVNVALTKDGKYKLNENIEAILVVQDELSGIEESKAPKNIKLDTSTKGKKKITLPSGIVKDKAGNLSEELIVDYEVIEQEIQPATQFDPPIDDTEEPEIVYSQKWSGLGMGLYCHDTGYFDMLLEEGFEYLRLDIPTYTNATWMSQSKSAVKTAVSKGAKVIWGVSSNGTTITSSNWPNFRQAILDAALWAQNNGVYEFQLGNEEEWHIDGTTMTANKIIQNLKSVATEVKQIFTNGKISYSCFPEFCQDWANEGKGDIDIIASNLYMGGNGNYSDYWKGLLDILINAFGVSNVYLTEFNVSWQSLTDYSINEAEQAEAIFEMIEYIKSRGIKRAIYFCFRHNNYGVLKEDGTYRTIIWNQALLSTDTMKLASVPFRASTTSLPDRVASMSN